MLPEKIVNTLLQLRLVTFNCKAVICFPVDDLLRDFSLASHRDEIVGAADHRTDCNDDNIDQRISNLARAEIGQIFEVSLDTD